MDHVTRDLKYAGARVSGLSEAEPTYRTMTFQFSTNSSLDELMEQGLSTTLEISRKYPTTQVTVIDRLTPPVADGTSVDTSRIIRPDKLLLSRYIGGT